MNIKMDLCYLRLLILAIFVIFPCNSSAQCIKSTPCTCIREDGMGYDITSLNNKKYVVAEKNITFSPCKNSNLTFNLSRFNETECNSTSICWLNAKNQSIDLGKFEEGVWESPNDSKNVNLVFRHNSANKSIIYETKINLICCPNCVKSILNIDSIIGTKYNLTLLSSKTCLIRLKSLGLSTGSVLVILLCVFSSLYFIGGAVALKVFRGAVGLELIPNYDFWSDLPGLVRDGVAFTFSGCSIGKSGMKEPLSFCLSWMYYYFKIVTLAKCRPQTFDSLSKINGVDIRRIEDFVVEKQICNFILIFGVMFLGRICFERAGLQCDEKASFIWSLKKALTKKSKINNDTNSDTSNKII